MNHFEDVKVHCPFYREHIMPKLRAQYHCAKCKGKYLAEKPGVHEVYHCKFNHMHIFLSKAELQAHECARVCKKDDIGQTLELFDPT